MKRAPGRRKVSGLQRVLLEADHSEKCKLLDREGLRPSPKAALPPCVFYALLSPVIWFSHKHQAPTVVNSSYAQGLWIPGALYT
jgi:hypothetical protein